jgi:hypothetical protein
MNPIDQLADERAKLKKANSKLRQAKLRMEALAVERDRALQTVDRANTANIRARAMICDLAGIPHDADILEWISGAKERIARMEEAGDSLKEEARPTMFDCDETRKRCMDAINAWDVAREAKP